MIGQIIKIDVLGLGIEPNIGKCMATLRYVHIGKQKTGIPGGKQSVSTKEAGESVSKED